MTNKISKGVKKGLTLLNNRKANLTGLTLIELMIVAALIIMFSSLTMPVGFNFYQESTLKDEARKLENSLRKAQAMAMTSRGDSNAGVKIEERQYTIFEGESFGTRREEIDTDIPFSIALSVNEIDGINEIVFQKPTGLPILPEGKTSIIITLTFGANSQIITINSQGRIEIGQTVLAEENGTACGSDSECNSGYCVDNVCCNDACTGLCKTCSGDDGGTAGTCHNTNDGYDLDEECSVINNCGADGYCNGSGNCNTGITADTNGILNGDIVYCDEHNRLWAPTASIDGSATTYQWGGYGTDEPTNSCIGVSDRPACNYCDNLIYAGYSDWELPGCLSGAKDSNCILYQFGIDACGFYPCTPSWDYNAEAHYYWSSTESAGNEIYWAYLVYFSDGGVYSLSKGAWDYVRCVRGQ